MYGRFAGVLLKGQPKEKVWDIGFYGILNVTLPCCFLFRPTATNHQKEFNILVNELKQYNPELLQKDFVIAISKSDMLDDELKHAIAKDLPPNIPHLFISSVTHQGIVQLKDTLWEILNKPVKS